MYEVTKIFKLKDELQEGFITTDPVPDMEYEELNCVNRNLYNEYRKNVYILEPKSYYRIELRPIKTEKHSIHISSLVKKALMVNIQDTDADEICLYVYNVCESNVYFDKNTIITF